MAAATNGTAVPAVDVPVLEARVRALEEQADARAVQSEADLDQLFILQSAFMIFFVQAGFVALEAGVVRYKNVRHILHKNMLDTVTGALVFAAIGFAVSGYADDTNPVIGTHNYFLVGVGSTQFAQFMLEWGFAATATTVVSGCMAERARMGGYFLITVLVTGLLYPLAVHWVWSPRGWLRELGALDYAGGAVVHVVGGICGLVGTMLLRPRIGRFSTFDSSETSSSFDDSSDSTSSTSEDNDEDDEQLEAAQDPESYERGQQRRRRLARRYAKEQQRKRRSRRGKGVGRSRSSSSSSSSGGATSTTGSRSNYASAKVGSRSARSSPAPRQRKQQRQHFQARTRQQARRTGGGHSSSSDDDDDDRSTTMTDTAEDHGPGVEPLGPVELGKGEYYEETEYRLENPLKQCYRWWFYPRHRTNVIPPHSLMMSSLGVLIIWFGFFAFNAASARGLSGGRATLVAQSAVFTTLCTCMSGFTVMAYLFIRFKQTDLMLFLNGVLAGLVTSTAGAGYCPLWTAPIFGFLGAGCFISVAWFLTRFRIDDPVDAIAVHAADGALSALLTGLFASQDNIATLRGLEPSDVEHYGLFLGGGARVLGANVLTLIVLTSMCALGSYVVFGLVNTVGYLRAPLVNELVGLDKHPNRTGKKINRDLRSTPRSKRTSSAGMMSTRT